LEAQSAAAHFYIRLTLIYVIAGVAFLIAPTVINLPAEEFKLALRVGGALIAALGAFPSAKYLRRRDRAYALQMIQSEHGRLEAIGLLASRERAALDRMIGTLVRGMMR
jgi:cytochrome c biogenesis protein CcdA